MFMLATIAAALEDKPSALVAAYAALVIANLAFSQLD